MRACPAIALGVGRLLRAERRDDRRRFRVRRATEKGSDEIDFREERQVIGRGRRRRVRHDLA